MPEDLSYTLGKLEQALANIDRRLDSFERDYKKTLDDHESRLRSVEKMQWKISGIAGMAGGIVVYVVPPLLEYFLKRML